MRRFILIIFCLCCVGILLMSCNNNSSDNMVSSSENFSSQEEHNNEHSAIINKYTKRSVELLGENTDSALFFAEKARSLLSDAITDSLRIDVFINLGEVYYSRGNFPLALSNFLSAKKIIDDKLISDPDAPGFTLKQFAILNKLGILYFSQKDYTQSLSYLNEALDVLEKSEPHQGRNTNAVNQFKALSNIAAVYMQQKEYVRALEYYKSAMHSDLFNALKEDSRLEATLYNNVGICYLELRDFGLADNYFRRALSLRENINDLRGEAQCLNNIAKNYVYTGNFNLATEYFKKALNTGRSAGSRESVLISLASLSSVYDTLRDYKNSLSAFKEYKELSDSLFNIESANRISQLRMQYEFEKQQKIFDLELKRKEAEQKSAELKYIIIGGSLFFLFLIAVLLFILQRSKLRNTMLEKTGLELENKHHQLEMQKLAEELEFKKRELTTNVMYLLKKNELITSIIEKMIQLRTESSSGNQKIIQEIIKELKSAQDSDVWSEFEAHFTHVHLGFYERLNKLFPDLSTNEKKLCAFLRLNMSTKDISAITYQSINSITVARSRLRKKLNIQGEDTNLVNFLISL